MNKVFRIFAAAMLVLVLGAAPALAGCAYYDAHGRHNYYQEDFAYPSCTRNGYTIITCSSCGVSSKDVTPAYGHSWTTVSKSSATCTSKGKVTKKCSECGETKTETTKALGHNYKVQQVLAEATCASEGSEKVKCSRCGKTTERAVKRLPHSYGEWTLSVPASDNAMGENARYCVNCGAAETESFYPEGTLYRDIKDREGVKALQTKLTACGYLNDKIDGLFGKKTEQAVKDFQTAAGIRVDGIAWPETAKLLTTEWEIKTGVATPAPTATPEPTPTPVPAAPVYECCTQLEGADGEKSYGLCEKHSAMAATAEMLMGIYPSGEGRISAFGQVRSIWEAEMELLYAEWSGLLPAEQAGSVTGSKIMFNGYLVAQENALIQQYGADSEEALSMVNRALADQCSYLCEMIYEAR